MPSKRWDTYKITLYGAFAGVLVLLAQIMLGQQTISLNGSDEIGGTIGAFIGSAAAGAVLCAAVSGIRNLIVRT
jgi:hypothetical protein